MLSLTHGGTPKLFTWWAPQKNELLSRIRLLKVDVTLIYLIPRSWATVIMKLEDLALGDGFLKTSHSGMDSCGWLLGATTRTNGPQFIARITRILNTTWDVEFRYKHPNSEFARNISGIAAAVTVEMTAVSIWDEYDKDEQTKHGAIRVEWTEHETSGLMIHFTKRINIPVCKASHPHCFSHSHRRMAVSTTTM